MTRAKGVVYVDNMVRKGLLADVQLAKTDPNVRGLGRRWREWGRMRGLMRAFCRRLGRRIMMGF